MIGIKTLEAKHKGGTHNVMSHPNYGILDKHIIFYKPFPPFS